MAGDQSVNVAEVVREIEAEVARRRAAGEYPMELLARLRAELEPGEDDEPAEVLAAIQSVRPIHSRRPLIGPLVVNLKRTLRRGMSWYVQPMAEDQTRFNRALLQDVRDLERRLSRVETPWAPGIGGPQAAVVAARAGALVAALETAPVGPIRLIGAAEPLREALCRPALKAAPELVEAARRPQAEDPLDRLEQAPGRSLAAVVLAGVLPCLSAAELIGIAGLAARALREGGLLVIDAPDPRHAPAPPDPSTVEVAMVRWVAPETAELLCEAAGLTSVQRPSTAGASGWYTVVAGRPR